MLIIIVLSGGADSVSASLAPVMMLMYKSAVVETLFHDSNVMANISGVKRFGSDLEWVQVSNKQCTEGSSADSPSKVIVFDV